MQRIVDARSARAAAVAPSTVAPPEVLRPSPEVAPVKTSRAVSMSRAEETLRRHLRRSGSDLHPRCLLDGVKQEMCQRTSMTESQFRSLSQKLLSELGTRAQ